MGSSNKPLALIPVQMKWFATKLSAEIFTDLYKQ